MNERTTSMPIARSLACAALAALLATGAGAQDAADGPTFGDAFGFGNPAAAFAPEGGESRPALDGLDVQPFAPQPIIPDRSDFSFPGESEASSQVVLTAALIEGGGSLQGGVDWKIFASEPDETGRLELVASAVGGSARLLLEPGSYFVHCQYGYAMNTVRLDVAGGIAEETIVLNAGGLKLLAGIGDRRLLERGEVNFDIYGMDYDRQGNRRVVARDVPPDTVVPLAAGIYHVVSEYGSVNAVIRADLTVEPGKLTEVTLFQSAAEVTLKLVRERGGEAIADTRWSVLTPGGDTVTDGVGAFPSFVLAAGDYTVVARHGESIYSRDFTVVAGEDGEVEVITSETREPS